MQIDVHVGGLPEALDQCDRATLGIVGLEPRLRLDTPVQSESAQRDSTAPCLRA